MSDQISNYKQLRVIIDPGKQGFYVALLARNVTFGAARDRMIFRSVLVPLSPTSTVEDCLRAAAAVLTSAADRL